MKRASLAASLSLCLLGCSRGPNSSSGECEKPCAHLAGLKLAPARAANKSRLHEIDEQLDSTEENAARTKAEIQQEVQKGDPYFNPNAFANLPAKDRKELAERRKWELAQLKRQRELALQRTDAAVLEVKQKYQELQSQLAAEEQKASAEAVRACMASCTQRPRKFSECLQRTQAVEDLALCERQ